MIDPRLIDDTKEVSTGVHLHEWSTLPLRYTYDWSKLLQRYSTSTILGVVTEVLQLVIRFITEVLHDSLDLLQRYFQDSFGVVTKVHPLLIEIVPELHPRMIVTATMAHPWLMVISTEVHKLIELHRSGLSEENQRVAKCQVILNPIISFDIRLRSLDEPWGRPWTNPSSARPHLIPRITQTEPRIASRSSASPLVL